MTEQNTETEPVADETDSVTRCPSMGMETGNTETETSDDSVDEPSDDTEPDTFPREYVEKLRDENAKYRQRAQQVDSLAARLHTELVRATGRLADPTDLPFDAEHLDDPDGLSHAVDTLLAAKPHLAARKPFGDIGQGATGSRANVDLAAILRQQAR